MRCGKDILADLRPVVLVPHPAKDDSDLLMAWRFLSDSDIENCLNEEYDKMEITKDMMVQKANIPSFMAVLRPVYNMSVKRTDTIKRLQALRK